MNQTMFGSDPFELRERAHDIRNPFSAIASAGHLIADAPDAARRLQLLDGIEQAAMRGGALTTNLLASVPRPPVRTFDVRERLTHLEPLLRSLMGPGDRLRIDLPATPAPIRADSERFDHIVIELATNARRAFRDAGLFVLRLRVRHGRIHLLVVDNGSGMTGDAVAALLAGDGCEGAHGTGFGQIRRFVAEMQGTLRLRSAPGRGTVIAIEVPAGSCLAR